MPNVEINASTISVICMIVSVYLQIPATWRTNAAFKYRCKKAVLILLWCSFYANFYNIFVSVIRRCPTHYQPVFVVVMPLIREVVGWVFSKLGSKQQV